MFSFFFFFFFFFLFVFFFFVACLFVLFCFVFFVVVFVVVVVVLMLDCKWIHLIDFLPFYHKEDNFCDFLFVFLNTKALLKNIYSRTSMAQTPMARLPWMSRTRS